jgi:predicted RNA-binding Zn-ribbon protein involved in translation (DUF1610 family)
MPIDMTCPNCGKVLRAPDGSQGRQAKCPACATMMTIPALAPSIEAFGAEEIHGADAPAGGARPAAGGVAAQEPARRPCPMCGEMIPVAAAKCRFCNTIFDPKLKQMDPRGLGANREELRQIASLQRGLLLCILAQLGAFLFNAATRGLAAGAQPGAPPNPLNIVAALVALAAGIAGLVYVVRLAARLYSTGGAVLFGLLALVPCLGLIGLLVVNGAATKKLQEHGIKVGLLGASMSQF